MFKPIERFFARRREVREAQITVWNEKTAIARELGSLIREGNYDYQIYAVLLFGSVATGNCRDDSDIDIAVIFDCHWSDRSEAWWDRMKDSFYQITRQRYPGIWSTSDGPPFHFTVIDRNRFEYGNGRSMIITAIHEDGMAI